MLVKCLSPRVYSFSEELRVGVILVAVKQGKDKIIAAILAVSIVGQIVFLVPVKLNTKVLLIFVHLVGKSSSLNIFPL